MAKGKPHSRGGYRVATDTEDYAPPQPTRAKPSAEAVAATRAQVKTITSDPEARLYDVSLDVLDFSMSDCGAFFRALSITPSARAKGSKWPDRAEFSDAVGILESFVSDSRLRAETGSDDGSSLHPELLIKLLDKKTGTMDFTAKECGLLVQWSGNRRDGAAFGNADTIYNSIRVMKRIVSAARTILITKG